MKKEHSFILGDRIFARITVHHQSIAEFIVDTVGDMSQLLAVVRERLRHKCKGLVKLYIRNISRGWSMERPFVAYPETYKDKNGKRHLSRKEILLSQYYPSTPTYTYSRL